MTASIALPFPSLNTGFNKSAEIIESRPKYVRKRQAPARSFCVYDKKDKDVVWSAIWVVRFWDAELRSSFDVSCSSCEYLKDASNAYPPASNLRVLLSIVTTPFPRGTNEKVVVVTLSSHSLDKEAPVELYFVA